MSELVHWRSGIILSSSQSTPCADICVSDRTLNFDVCPSRTDSDCGEHIVGNFN